MQAIYNLFECLMDLLGILFIYIEFMVIENSYCCHGYNFEKRKNEYYYR